MNRYRIPTIYFLSEMSNKEKKKERTELQNVTY